MKNFLVFTEPHAADPALLIPVYERNEDGTATNHSSGKPLLDAFLEVQHQASKTAGRQEGIEDVLKVFGLTYDEYIKKAAVYHTGAQ